MSAPRYASRTTTNPGRKVNIIVDVDNIDVTAAGTIDIATSGCLPVISARVVEALANDASVQAVLFDGAGHHVDHLLGLSGRSHRRVHGHGWHVTLDPDTAQATFTRGERTWVTLPRGTRVRRPQPPA